jgi:hypothetical protein
MQFPKRHISISKNTGNWKKSKIPAILCAILELVLWNGLQSRSRITPDVMNVIKMPSFQYFLYLREQKKVIGC